MAGMEVGDMGGSDQLKMVEIRVSQTDLFGSSVDFISDFRSQMPSLNQRVFVQHFPERQLVPHLS